MLITLIYMFATYMQSRKIAFMKAQLLNIFKKGENSVLCYNLTQHKCLEEKKESFGLKLPYDTFLSPMICCNFPCAEIKESLWHQADRELYTIYPQQKIYLGHFLNFPCGKVTHPFLSNNSFKISNKSECKQYLLIQTELKIYNPPDSSNFIQLEDYGLIVAYCQEQDENAHFILETDIDHITNFLIMMMQGHYINNGLNLIRVLSVFPVEWPIIPCDKSCTKRHVNMSDTIWVDKPIVVKESKLSSEVSDFLQSSKEGSFSPAPKQGDNSLLPSKEGDFSPSSKEDNQVNTEWSYSDKLFEEYIDESSDEKSHLRRKDSLNSSNVNSDHPLFKRKNGRDLICGSPNILLCADNDERIRNIKNLVEHIISPCRYDVLTLSTKDARSNVWVEDAALVIAAGNFDAEIISQFVEYVVQGGKLLALCSNMLHTLLPIFKTAEMRESKLVKVSYDTYKGIDLVHDIFCYQASPVRARFSQENEEVRTSEMKLPATIEVKGKEKLYTFNVTELGREETWHNPSILLATLPATNGKIVFSQIHLEIDPTKYASEEKSIVLKDGNSARFDIVRHLFQRQFSMDVTHEVPCIEYTPAYFLGDIKKQTKMIENLRDKIRDEVLKMPKYKVQFCRHRTEKIPASSTFLPILLMTYIPRDSFKTDLYFNSLQTENIGRLIIFSDILTSSMNVTGTKLEHGLAVIARQQTRGLGRVGNTWLSPDGCAMFTVQLHIPKDSFLGGHITILQHIVSVAIVLAVKSRPGCENLNLNLKWPNDVYVYKEIKIGGTLICTQLEGSLYICNIGTGINLDNNIPTTCINKLIAHYNEKHKTSIQPLKYEEYFALVFNKLEYLINKIQNDNSLTYFRNLYYEYWMHMNAKVLVTPEQPNKPKFRGRIVGIDDFGFLLVQKKGKMDDLLIHSVHPDGNSFDPLKKLILPKQKN